MPGVESGGTREGYVVVNGVRTYYEERGSGEPLLFLHGGLCTAEMCQPQTVALAAQYRVLVPERRGHGRTPDVPGPLSYEMMARDTTAFMDALGISTAHLVGWSDGALVGLLVAMGEPERVRRLVFMGQALNLDGLRPGTVEYMSGLTARAIPAYTEAYERLSPDGPGHFAVVLDKLKRLWCAPTGVTLDRLAGVRSPTLILIGDNDIVDVAHAAAMYQALPEGRLGVVPNGSHHLPMERPDVVNQFMLAFLSEDEPAPVTPPRVRQRTHASDGAVRTVGDGTP
ncbi:alpha/beta fold hydrolase [Micromonospora sp. WMMD734]|uniref:Alpha/beta hydrolase n=1 Tax=Micromonospora humidisoli TaxID=2807622 RepID=A0ABS2JMH7_9ACTN|nr:alpha/beta hydrolase [Micromonospora humidisoli]MBM7086669.1 alpha/beta hydrolase [Micromonospora humidisoli]